MVKEKQGYITMTSSQEISLFRAIRKLEDAKSIIKDLLSQDIKDSEKENLETSLIYLTKSIQKL